MRSPTSRGQRGFTLIEVMTASVMLSILVLGLSTFWVVADRRANELVMRQKAIFVASGEMERLTALYGGTTFGSSGPVSGTSYDGLSGFPATRLTYPTSVSGYAGGPAQEFITTSASTFGSGSSFQVWVNSQFFSTANRAYVWIDEAQNVMGRLSWTATTIAPSSCVGSDGCKCLNYAGFFGGSCQRIDLYLEYPFRLVSGSPTTPSNFRSVTLSTIVGRHT